MLKLKIKNKQENLGITLVALVVTVIVLIILVGVTFNIILGKNGIFDLASKAGENYVGAQREEEKKLIEYEGIINQNINESRDEMVDESEDEVIEESEDEVKLEEYAGNSDIASSNEILEGFYAYNEKGNVLEGKLKEEDIKIESININISRTAGGNSNSAIDNLAEYKTLKISSRTKSGNPGTVYFQIIGYYLDDDQNLISENILNTVNTSDTEEIFNIDKYNKIRFVVNCTAVIGDSWAWYTFRFNEITISKK